MTSSHASRGYPPLLPPGVMELIGRSLPPVADPLPPLVTWSDLEGRLPVDVIGTLLGCTRDETMDWLRIAFSCGGPMPTAGDLHQVYGHPFRLAVLVHLGWRHHHAFAAAAQHLSTAHPVLQNDLMTVLAGPMTGGVVPASLRRRLLMAGVPCLLPAHIGWVRGRVAAVSHGVPSWWDASTCARRGSWGPDAGMKDLQTRWNDFRERVLRRHPYATIASSLGMLRDEFLFWLRHVHLLAGGDPLHDGITATLVPVRSSASIPVGRGRRHTVPWDPVSLPALEIQKESPAARQHEPRLVDLPTGDGNVKARLRAASKAPVPPRADPWSRHHPEWSAWVRTAVTDLLDRRSSLELIRRIESMDPLLLIQWAQGPLGKEMDACTILSPPESAHGHVAQQPPRTPPT